MEEYKCPICYQLFKCKNNLIKHQEKKNKCNIITPFKCEKCCKYFKQNRVISRIAFRLFRCERNFWIRLGIITKKNRTKSAFFQ